MQIGEKIRKIRTLKGYSQEYMAGQLKMSQVNYSDIELGKTKLNTETLERIAALFEMKASDVLSFDEKYIFNNNAYENSQSKFYNLTIQQNEVKELYEQQIKQLREENELLKSLLKKHNII